MNHEKLIRHLKNLKKIMGSNELAQFLLLKKAENFLRDLIVLEIDSSLRKQETIYQTAVREINKHDFVIMEGTINKEGYFNFQANTIIEMKYTTTAWILENANAELDKLEVGQDNIWRENMTYKSQIGKHHDENYKIGKEPSGIKKDIEKMNDTKLPNVSNKHHILAIVSPHYSVPLKYRGLFFGQSEKKGFELFKKHLPDRNHKNNENIFEKTEQILKRQLKIVNDSFFNISPIESKLVSIGTIGEALKYPLTFISL
jgi:hypothetical protein